MIYHLAYQIEWLAKQFNQYIIGREHADKNFKPVFRKDTPEDILKMYKKYCDLLELEKHLDSLYEDEIL